MHKKITLMRCTSFLFLILISLNFTTCKALRDKKLFKFSVNCTNIGDNLHGLVESKGYTVKIFHKDGEPIKTNRIMISRDSLEIEILPSKGFSIGKTILNGKPVLWDSPIGLPDPESLDFSSDEISVEGIPSKGFTYIRTFVGGIELLGLTNWGMPTYDSVSGKQLPLHGEVSNIPIETVDFEITENQLRAKGEIIYRTMEGHKDKPWWKRGEQMYRITKTIIIDKESSGFTLYDTICNISPTILKPDWGYHVTFSPENGSRLLIPSLGIEERHGFAVPVNADTWYAADDENVRTEIGIIHKSLLSFNLSGRKFVRMLMLHPDGRSFELIVPLTPYLQTWYSTGGRNSNEFTYNDGTPVFNKSWNGFGIELGSSPLDHNRNIDKTVNYKALLEPGEKLGICISIKMLPLIKSEQVKTEIESYNAKRN